MKFFKLGSVADLRVLQQAMREIDRRAAFKTLSTTVHYVWAEEQEVEDLIAQVLKATGVSFTVEDNPPRGAKTS